MHWRRPSSRFPRACTRNPTAGSSGDVTNFLSLILSDPVLSKLDPPLLYQGFYDREVVRKAFEQGVGASFECALGAKFDTVKSRPVRAKVTVKSLKKQWEGVNGADSR